MWTSVLCTCTADTKVGLGSSPGVLNHESQGEDSEEYPKLHVDREECHFLILQLGPSGFILGLGEQ